MVRILGSHPRDPGSNPGNGILFHPSLLYLGDPCSSLMLSQRLVVGRLKNQKAVTTYFPSWCCSMAVGDDVTEGFVSPLGISSIKSEQDGEMLSAEDVAWADSCLTKDPEVLDNGWDSMKEALLETLSVQHDSSAHEEDKFSEQPKMETSSSIELTDDINNSSKPDVSTTASNGKQNQAAEDLFVQELQLDLSTEDIFKVWDLNIPPEDDDDLTKRLHKALEQNSSEPTTSVSDHSKAWKGLNGDESLDDLISGIADLSLSPTSH
ncbi:UNVERIFIED_CONTAM: hypothetical protein Sangu_1072800 [Sesamum angustifolium]|uniref:Uncharacterized protein n=1 Tax=Sesamum angustifolium TaxID=2727405 RepID=A0AAW2NX35_9LAMI